VENYKHRRKGKCGRQSCHQEEPELHPLQPANIRLGNEGNLYTGWQDSPEPQSSRMFNRRTAARVILLLCAPMRSFPVVRYLMDHMKRRHFGGITISSHS
jgi:hypothetical protein